MFVCLLGLILVLIRRYDDIHTSISVELIQTLLLYFREGRLEQDIIYPIGKIISCYVLRLTSVTSVLLNPLLSFLQSLVPNIDVLVDSLQTTATPSSSLIVFEQFLLYIAGHRNTLRMHLYFSIGTCICRNTLRSLLRSF